MAQIEAEDLTKRIREALAGWKASVTQAPGLVQAAVIVPILEKDGQAHFLFTKRTTHVAQHKGEICFPGGHHETRDSTLLDTALRETHEEIGLPPEAVEVLGEMSQEKTYATRFIISPFVARIPYPYPFRADPHEIEEIMAIPVESLRNKNGFREETWSFDGAGTRPVCFFSYQGYIIWGATARILKSLLEMVYGPDWQIER